MHEMNNTSQNMKLLRLLANKLEQIEQQIAQISIFLFDSDDVSLTIDTLKKLQKQVDLLQKQLRNVSVANSQVNWFEETYCDTQSSLTERNRAKQTAEELYLKYHSRFYKPHSFNNSRTVTDNRQTVRNFSQWLEPRIEKQYSGDEDFIEIELKEFPFIYLANQEFKFQRMFFLLGLDILGLNTVNQIYPFSLSTKEFWELYDRGERDFTGLNLTKVNLLGRTLRPINFSQANFARANLNNANLSNANLSNANLSRANLCMVTFYGTRLEKANLAGIDCYKANLERAQLNQANLSLANLSYANLSGADLTGANLTGAKLLGANLTNAKLEKAIFGNTQFNGATMPNGEIYSQKAETNIVNS